VVEGDTRMGTRGSQMIKYSVRNKFF